jgi:hypothetical protein
MKSTALYVRLDMPPIELKVYVYDMQELTGEGWQVDETLSIVSNVSGTRRYAIGDTVGIRVYRFLAAKRNGASFLCKFHSGITPPITQ